ncbi:MAG: recombinase family protein [Clostridia bacterium]|nr:recombinase family protein [Clostridia bacterium]
MDKAYIYTRVSTEMQVDGFSLAAQKDDIQRYAKLRNIQIVGEFSDEGKSGKNDKRPEFMKMIDAIKENRDDVKYVLVFKLSRFSRNAADVLKNLQLLQDNGVNLICIKEGLDSSNAAGKLMVTVMSAVAEMELENIHTQTMAGRKQKAKEGKWNGGFAPYGYTIKNDTLEIVENEAKTVRYIFELFADEHLGAMGVAKRLNAEGVKKVVRQNGKLDYFTADFVKKILDNPVYMGKIAYGRRKTEKVNGEHGRTRVVKEKDDSNIILVDGLHQAIVTEELWNRAHSKRVDTGKRKEKLEQEHQYILSGLVKCPSCHQSMYGVPNRKKKKDGTYYKISYAYKCRQTRNTNGIPCECSKQYNCRELDDEFASAIALCLLTPEIIQSVMERLNKEFDVSKLESKLKELTARQRELQGIQKKYEQAQRNLDIADKHYDRKFENYARQLDELYDQLDEVETLIYSTQEKINNATATKKSKQDAIDLIMMFGTSFAELSPLAQKQFANMLVDSIEIFPTKRDMGWIKSIDFKIPVFQDAGVLKNRMTIWDYYPDILDENGYFNGYQPEDELPDRDMLKERADADGNIVVVEEGTETPKITELQLNRINAMRREKGLSELTVDEVLTICRPKQITDESVALFTKNQGND